MGAQSFTVIGKGKTAKEAFRAAVDAAQYEYGHSGYTGTIAEKKDFVKIRTLTEMTLDEALAVADRMIRDGDARIDSKWGPAGALALHGEEWLFFGWAPS